MLMNTHEARLDALRSFEARAETGGTRVISLGCGSAREVQLHLQDPAAMDAPVTFTLIDPTRLDLPPQPPCTRLR